jgi:uncharacterized iron-regulated protein
MLKYYSKYNEVTFGKNEVIKKINKTQNGINFDLNSVPTFNKIKEEPNLNTLYSEIKDKKIIYVGESHTNFSHHLNQLRVVKLLHEKGKDVSIAMEMFQKPFQKDIDDYIQGKTTLNEFLEKSQYYKRWKFDYNLYKPILDYARQNNIKVVALNIDRSITQQVSKKGLFSLSDKQKELLPKTIDQSNLSYKKNLDLIFKEHIPENNKTNKHIMPKINLDFFYQSQLIWDEIMAENIYEYVKNNKEKVLVVIVGFGHIKEHDGIPSRVYKKNRLPFSVLLNDANTSKNGDIIINNKTKTKINSQNKLGIYLKNTTELIATNTVKNSFSNKIGVLKGDLILKLNSTKVKSLYDLKRFLYFVDNLNNVKITVKRKGETLRLPIK